MAMNDEMRWEMRSSIIIERSGEIAEVVGC